MPIHGPVAGAGAGAGLSDQNPQANADAAAPGAGNKAAREDHVHPRPKRHIAAAAPTVNDDETQGYSAWSLWADTTGPEAEVYRCLDAAAGAAAWVKTTLTIDELGSLAATDDAPADGKQYTRKDGAWAESTAAVSAPQIAAAPPHTITGTGFTVPITVSAFGATDKDALRLAVDHRTTAGPGEWTRTSTISVTTLGAHDVQVSGLEINTGYDYRPVALDALNPSVEVPGEIATQQTLNVTVDTPTLTVTGELTDVPETPIIEGSAFAVSGGSDTHQDTDWQILNAAQEVVWESLADSANKTSIVVPAGNLAEATTYTVRARYRGVTYGESTWATKEVTTKAAFALIIGVAIDSTGGNGGTFRWVDADGADFTPGAGFFDAHPCFGGIEAVTIDSQYMAKVPAGYCKTGTISGGGSNNGKKAWWVSDVPASGFHLHPAFMEAGAAIDQFWFGGYQGTDGGSSKLASQPGVLPLVSLDHPTLVTRATNRNTGGVTGFMLQSWHQLSWIQRLYLIENKSMNCQAVTGDGRVSQSSAANTDAADVAQATYRGMVGLWGNVRTWVQGVKTVNGRLWVWDDQGNRTWVDTGVDVPNAGWFYPLTFSAATGTGFDLADGFIPATTTGTGTDATCPDGYYWNTTDERAWTAGGHWSDGADAGLWCAAVHYAPSTSGTHIGARLAKV